MNNRTTILANAIQLFASRGYDAVGIQEIAVRSGITKPTLYYYFGSKKGLLEAILTEYSGPLFQVIRDADYKGDLFVSLETLATGYFQFAQENAMFYRMQLAMYFAAPESEPNHMIHPLNETQHRLIEDLFRKAAESESGLNGNLRRGYAATLMGTINTYIGFALNGYLELNQTLVHQVVDQFLHGIYKK
jgi:TetR/AcrR family transcriptional regulator